jgi:hypothetical protein
VGTEEDSLRRTARIRSADMIHDSFQDFFCNFLRNFKIGIRARETFVRLRRLQDCLPSIALMRGGEGALYSHGERRQTASHAAAWFALGAALARRGRGWA